MAAIFDYLFERQMFEEFQDILGLTPEENKRAVDQCYRSLNYFDNVTMRGAAREVLALPMFPELTEAEQKYVAETIAEFYS